MKAFINLKITLEYRWFFCNLIQFARFICSFLEFSFLRCELNTIHNIFRTESLLMAHREKRLVFTFNSCLWCNIQEHLAQHEIGFVCFALLWFSIRNITNMFVKIVQMKTRMNQQLFEFNFMAKRKKIYRSYIKEQSFTWKKIGMKWMKRKVFYTKPKMRK